MESGLDLKRHSKYFFIGSFLLIIILSIILAWSFVAAIFGAVVLSYLFYPVYDFIFRKIKSSTLSAFLVSILVVIIFVVPLLFITNTIIKESSNFFFAVRNIDFESLGTNYIDRLVGENIDIPGLLEDALNRLSIVLIENVDKFILDLPKKILSVFVMLFVMFYLFKDGRKLIFNVKEALPLKRKYKDDIAKKFSDTIYATMYGLVVTAIIQGIVGGIGLWIFDVQNPILWGGVMIIASMLPFIGSAFVWLPAAILKLGAGDTANGAGLLIYGLFIVSTIDNIIRPKIIGRRSKVHPALVLVGALGGIRLFGLIGIIIGPLVLAILTVFFELYLIEEYEEL